MIVYTAPPQNLGVEDAVVLENSPLDSILGLTPEQRQPRIKEEHTIGETPVHVGHLEPVSGVLVRLPGLAPVGRSK